MSVVEILAALLLAVGMFFFAAGLLGLLRFPDVYTRVHALTKADNLGLGFVVIAMMLLAESWFAVAKLLLIWFLVIASGATSGILIAEASRVNKISLWSKPE